MRLHWPAVEWTDALILALTYLGSAYAHVTVAALCAWWISPRAGVQVGLVFAASFLVNWWIKDWVAYPRPFELGAGPVSDLVRATAIGTSWPSGHVQNTTAVWSFLALTRGGPRGGGRPRAWLWALAAALVTLVAATRLVLGVHALQDVLGGLAVGLAVAAGATGVVRWQDRRSGRRSPDGGS
jgi:membrane-associated phospholipid phosphatase